MRYGARFDGSFEYLSFSRRLNSKPLVTSPLYSISFLTIFFPLHTFLNCPYEEIIDKKFLWSLISNRDIVCIVKHNFKPPPPLHLVTFYKYILVSPSLMLVTWLPYFLHAPAFPPPQFESTWLPSSWGFWPPHSVLSIWSIAELGPPVPSPSVRTHLAQSPMYLVAGGAVCAIKDLRDFCWLQ